MRSSCRGYLSQKSLSAMEFTDTYFKKNRSIECRDRLVKSGLISEDTEWEPKLIGLMTGLVTYKEKKEGDLKRIFVKEYFNQPETQEYTNDIEEYAAFAIMKTCGGRVPKVKLKGVRSDLLYLFSKDIAEKNSRHPGRMYDYMDMHDGEFDVYRDYVTAGNQSGMFSRQPSFEIDKVSVARFLLLGLMLNLCDFHDQNIGFVVSSEGNVKLGCVDFSIDNRPFDFDSNFTIDQIVRVYYDRMTLDSELNSLILQMTESHYQQAFAKIEENFADACEYVASQVDNMPFIKGDRKEKFSRQMDIWRRGFEILKHLVDQSKKPFSLFSLRK